MEDPQRILVRDHIRDLHRDADALRAARRVDGHDGRSDDDVGASKNTASGGVPVRVRFGQWLIGVGAAVAGPDRDGVDGAAGHAA